MVSKKSIILLGLFTLILICVSPVLAQDQTPPILLHVPQTDAEELTDLKIEVTVTDMESDIRSVYLYFRVRGESEYQQVPMANTFDLYSAKIPMSYVTDVGLEYYIDVQNSAGLNATFPETSPDVFPVNVNVRADGTETSEAPEIIQLSPEPGDLIPQGGVMIAASIYDPNNDVDISSIRIMVDNRDLTRQALVTGSLVTLNLLPPILPGSHQISITARDKKGNAAQPVSWEFFTQRYELKESHWQLNGNLILSAQYNNYSGDGADALEKDDWLNEGSLNMSATYDWFKMSAYLFLTSAEDDMAQPRNRFLIDFKTSFMGVQLGDVSPQYSELTLSGRRVRGVSANIGYGPLQLSYVYAQANRAVERENPNSSIFARDVRAGRLELGSDKVIKLGATFVKAKDDTASVDFQRDPIQGTNAYQITGPTTRMDNVVVGTDLGINLPFIKSTVKAELASSVQNVDILARGLNPAEEEVINNELDDAGGLNLSDLSDVIDITTGVMVPGESSVAMDVGWETTLPQHQLKVNYRSVGRSYYSIANSSIIRDYAGVRVNTRSRLLNNRMIVSVGFRNFKDNLDDTQITTTTSTTAEAAVNYHPKGNLPDFNLAFRMYKQADDSTLVDNVTNTITLGSGYNLKVGGGRTSLYGNVRYLTFKNSADNTASQFSTDYSNMALALSIQSSFSMPLRTTLSLGYNVTSYDNDNPNVKLLSLGLGANYRFWQDKLVTSLDLSTVSSNREADEDLAVNALDNGKMTFSLGSRYYFNPALNVGLKVGYIDFTDNEQSGVDYSDNFVQLQLEKRF